MIDGWRLIGLRLLHDVCLGYRGSSFVVGMLLGFMVGIFISLFYG